MNISTSLLDPSPPNGEDDDDEKEASAEDKGETVRCRRMIELIRGGSGNSPAEGKTPHNRKTLKNIQ